MAGEKSAASIADFEKSLDELEKLVHDLEQGELSLEQSLTAFERGVKLTRECQQALKTAGAADYPRSCKTQHAGRCKANARTGSGHKGCFSLECCHWYLLILAVV
jgi:exodeoxyribonuclease VII small subunit